MIPDDAPRLFEFDQTLTAEEIARLREEIAKLKVEVHDAAAVADGNLQNWLRFIEQWRELHSKPEPRGIARIFGSNWI